MQVQTIRVKREGDRGSHLINLSDFNPDVHEPADDEAKKLAKAIDREERDVATHYEARRRFDANRGQIGGGVPASGRNPSGTFSEPTPTDVRFPNKMRTEFENNAGAFVGKSAAGLRAERGMPQVPGGIGGKVAIPSRWRKLSGDEQIKLAGELTGKDDLSIKQSKQVIQDEIHRRIEAGVDVQDGMTDEERAALEEAKENVETEIPEDLKGLRTHESLDQYLNDQGLEAPEGWDDMKINEKRDWLTEQQSD